jgi:hypothetical protein
MYIHLKIAPRMHCIPTSQDELSCLSAYGCRRTWVIQRMLSNYYHNKMCVTMDAASLFGNTIRKTINLLTKILMQDW